MENEWRRWICTTLFRQVANQVFCMASELNDATENNGRDNFLPVGPLRFDNVGRTWIWTRFNKVGSPTSIIQQLTTIQLAGFKLDWVERRQRIDSVILGLFSTLYSYFANRVMFKKKHFNINLQDFALNICLFSEHSQIIIIISCIVYTLGLHSC